MSTRWQAGDRIAEYELATPLGQGGFGSVWVAHRDGRRVALKLLELRNEEAERRFDREARALALIEHPNTVKIFAHGVDRGVHYIAMELVEAETLAAWSLRPHTDAEKLGVLGRIAAALAHAHSQGVLHRDLKPNNILVPKDVAESRIVDFGIAKLVGVPAHDVTKTGEVLGTPGFMSPEQLRGAHVGPASDVYALGLIAFELLSGAPPFRGDSAIELAMAHLQYPAPELLTASPALARMVSAMLDKAPERRPTLAAFRRVLDGKPTAAPRTPRSKRPTAVVVGMVGAALIAGAAWLWPRGESQDSPRSVVRASAMGLLVQPDVAPVRAVAIDEEEPDLGTTHVRLGCSGAEDRLQPGVQTVLGALTVRIPAADMSTPRPILVVFHDFWMPTQQVMATPGIAEEAEKRGWIVFSPQSALRGDIWEHPQQFDTVVDQLKLLGEVVCLDPDRVLLLGLGRGGRAVGEVASRLGNVRALATTSFRAWNRSSAKQLAGDVPTLFVSALEDGLSPADGGKDCFANTDSWSIARHQTALTKLYACNGKGSVTYRSGGSKCELQSDCETELEFCSAAGGRHWQGMMLGTPELAELFQKATACKPGVTKFPMAKHVFEFFDRHVRD